MIQVINMLLFLNTSDGQVWRSLTSLQVSKIITYQHGRHILKPLPLFLVGFFSSASFSCIPGKGFLKICYREQKSLRDLVQIGKCALFCHGD